jgi:long-chain acyl-CoA synthetase
MTYEEIVQLLTGPGGMFEVGVEDVRGRPTKNFSSRERNLREKIANAANRGDLTFLVQGKRRISYADMARTVWGAAHRLAEHGFRPGDRLAIFAFNSPDWLMAMFGATSMGGVAVGLNGWWVTEEIEYGLRDSGSRFLVTDERLYPRVAELIGRIDGLEKVFYIGDDPPPGTIPIADLLQPRDDMPTVPIGEDDPFVILYTSGTTGRPKGCITTHRGTVSQVLGVIFSTVASAMLEGNEAALTPPAGQPCSLLTSPLFHVGGIHSNVCLALTAGSRLVFSEGKFDPVRILQLIQDEKVNAWGAIPTMLHRVVHHPDVGKYDLSSLRTVSFGGAPTAPETIEKACEVLPIRPTFANVYGLTETHGVATMNVGKALLGKKTAAGRVIPVLDVKILGGDGSALGPRQLGEILLSGATITPGYWNRPDATAETVRDGWLHTGDLGYLDDDGFLYVVDRAKDMILRGGENVYCVEIENCLADHPDIDEAAIIGVPDVELGQRVKAIVRRRAGSGIDASEVQRHVAAHLASFKVPEFVDFIDEPLPRNPAGKILKNLLRGDGAVSVVVDGGE